MIRNVLYRFDNVIDAGSYDPTTWRIGRWFLKLGPLTLYVYSHGIGWTYHCGLGHELRWRRL